MTCSKTTRPGSGGVDNPRDALVRSRASSLSPHTPTTPNAAGHVAIGCPECAQTVTLDSPTPVQNRFRQAVVNFQGAPDFSPTRIAEPGPNGFPLARFQPGAVAGPGYSPFIRMPGSDVVYSAPIVVAAACHAAWREAARRVSIPRVIDPQRG